MISFAVVFQGLAFYKGIQGDGEHIAYHVIQQLILLVVLMSQKRIIINLQQPQSKVLIYQEVISEQLKTILPLLLIEFTLD